MIDLVKSAGGIVYYLEPDGEIKFLLIKRHALSGKIERVAPKGKLQNKEGAEKAAAREVSEETGIPINLLKIRESLGDLMIRGLEDQNGKFEKEVTYFLMQYEGDPDLVDIQLVEGYLGKYKWATIAEVLNLVYYADMRELFRKGYLSLRDKKKKDDVKKDFMKKLEL
ncbi:MAG TPA: NUDIX domain-containing protein [Candidatus Absconditabacterales bacterium]|nr:NUDIX domain-containing protein [Candidatus Absconditabacterales bacterium]